MSISFQPLIQNAANSTLTCLPDARIDSDAYEINVSNSNGLDILEALGLEPVSYGDLPIENFAGLLSASMRQHLDQRSPAMGAHIDAAPGRLTIIHCGRPTGYIEERFNALAKLVQRGRAAGATHIGWG